MATVQTEVQGLVKKLITKVSEYLSHEKVALVEAAVDFAAEAHDGQVRASGTPFIEHPLQTALLLADLKLDAAAIAAALLHDVVEDCNVPLEAIEQRFGPEVARLVEGVTKLSRIQWSPSNLTDRRLLEQQAQNLRKMFVAMAEDIRVVLIKLADRLHNMRTLEALPPEKARRVAQETMDIYAPLAGRLGIWQFKWELEDLAFRCLEPERYREIARLIRARRASRERYIGQVVEVLKRELERAGIKAEVTGRPKHIYSIAQKVAKYAEQGKDFTEIYDLLAVRILVHTVQDCYSALGVVHSIWHPIPGHIDDYIANPKPSGYQSLHTTVIALDGRPLEVQIRTYEMHWVAEYGVAAHWKYKEGRHQDPKFEDKIAWLRQLMEWQRDMQGALEFVESVKSDIFRDQVYVFTPKGELKELPAGSTPIDFAYRIHTELGHRCIGAKVNGRLVPLDYQLQNGDVVEIIASKQSKGPSRDWLNPNLGYVRTSHAREKIRQWFRKQERASNIERGRELVEKELRRLGIQMALEDLAKLFNYEKVDDFLVAVGCGDIHPHQIGAKVAEPPPAEAVPLAERPPQTDGSAPYSVVDVMGIGDLLTNLAKCCNPIPGDPIIGYITRGKGVTVHRRNCPNVLNEDEKDRLIQVSWGRSPRQVYPASIRLEAWDRVGLLRDVSAVVSEEKVNITYVSTRVRPDRSAVINLTVETTGLDQLSRVMAKLEGIRGVISVTRELGRGSETA
ncbi:MAG: (p)ppGpp synthetase [Chloroflexota bacterium]